VKDDAESGKKLGAMFPTVFFPHATNNNPAVPANRMTRSSPISESFNQFMPNTSNAPKMHSFPQTLYGETTLIN